MDGMSGGGPSCTDKDTKFRPGIEFRSVPTLVETHGRRIVGPDADLRITNGAADENAVPGRKNTLARIAFAAR